VERRFADAYARARADCQLTADGVLVPFFGAPHLVSHPQGEVTAAGRPVHVAAAILLLHYLLTAEGAPPAGRWAAFRELPGGLFYAASFAARAEAPLARAFAADAAGLEVFSAAATRLGGEPLELGDAAASFAALPRVPVAVLVWRGDDEMPGEAKVLFDAGAGGYLPPEDLAGLGGLLAGRLAAADSRP
jgi:hypothetical protein